ncbi:energy transducer TonB [Prochlorococcus marinus]|uniref:energy transducer TonB n=1 Tax=Prochlorococcus marinus TaxID=1219 RepID=UPI0002DF49D8|nr:energy transducer TonB [Prochlorococcus marinus]
MIKKYEKFILLKNWELSIGLIISLCAHILLFTGLDFKNDNLLGDKFIPIEFIDIDTSFNVGDSFDETQSKNIENNSDLKEEKLIKELQEETIEKSEEEVAEKKIINQESLIKKIDLENKYRGIVNGKKDEDIERGSILGDGLEKITCLNCIKPKYPKIAIQRGFEGILKLKVTIQKNGSVKDVLVIQSTGYKILDNAGIKAAQESKFYPLSKKSELNIVYELKLN